jgi:hypothetical protein
MIGDDTAARLERFGVVLDFVVPDREIREPVPKRIAMR